MTLKVRRSRQSTHRLAARPPLTVTLPPGGCCPVAHPTTHAARVLPPRPLCRCVHSACLRPSDHGGRPVRQRGAPAAQCGAHGGHVAGAFGGVLLEVAEPQLR